MVGWSRVPRSGKASAWSELSRGARTAGDGRDQRTASFAFGALWEGFWARFSLDHAGCPRLYPRGVAKGE